MRTTIKWTVGTNKGDKIKDVSCLVLGIAAIFLLSPLSSAGLRQTEGSFRVKTNSSTNFVRGAQNEFNGSQEENITFPESGGNVTRWVEVPRNSEVTNADLKLKGMSSEGFLPDRNISSNSHVYSIKFSPEDRYLAVGGGTETVKIYNATSYEPVIELNQSSSDIYTISWSNEYIAYGGSDNKIYIHNKSGNWSFEKKLSNVSDNIISSGFSSRGNFAYGREDGSVYIYNTSDWALGKNLTGAEVGRALSFSPSNNLLAFGEGYLNIYSMTNESIQRSLNDSIDPPGMILTADFSAHGKYMAYGGENNHTYVYNTTDWSLRKNISTSDTVSSLAFSGGKFALGNKNRNVYIYNTSTWNLTHLLKRNSEVRSVDLSEYKIADGGMSSHVYVNTFKPYPRDLYLKVKGTDTKQWDHPSRFLGSDTVQINSSLVNKYISNCQASLGQRCNIPLKLHSETEGKTMISDLSFTFDYNVTHLFHVSGYTWNRNEVAAGKKYNMSRIIKPTGYSAPFNISISGYYLQNNSSDTCKIDGETKTVNAESYCSLEEAVRKDNTWREHTYWESSFPQGVPVEREQSEHRVIDENITVDKNVSVYVNVSANNTQNVTFNVTVKAESPVDGVYTNTSNSIFKTELQPHTKANYSFVNFKGAPVVEKNWALESSEGPDFRNYTYRTKLMVHDNKTGRRDVIYNINLSRLDEWENRVEDWGSLTVDNQSKNEEVTTDQNYAKLIVYYNFLGNKTTSLEGGSHILKLPYKMELEDSTGTSGSSTTTSVDGTCTENWVCSNWSECYDGFQYRNCVDANNCGTLEDKPNTDKSCQTVGKENEEGCIPNWECKKWSECTGGTRTRECEDVNRCETPENRPPEEEPCGDNRTELPQQAPGITGRMLSTPSSTIGVLSFISLLVFMGLYFRG